MNNPTEGTPVRAVVTGDVVGSSELELTQRARMPETLRAAHRAIQMRLDEMVLYPIDLFGGDSWQMYLPEPTLALAVAVTFRATLFADHGIRTRMAIAIDTIDFLNTENLSESDGRAFRRSGRTLQQMRGDSMEILLPQDSSRVEQTAVQAVTRCVDHIARGWTRAQAQSIKLMMDCRLASESCSQAQIGKRWQPHTITQQAVARHLQAAGWDIVERSIADFESVAAEIFPSSPKAES